jgi:hypothetical protein
LAAWTFVHAAAERSGICDRPTFHAGSRLDARSEKQIHRQSLADLERVEGKMQILSRVAEIVVDRKNVL